MFRCDYCKQVSEPNEPMKRIVTETRDKDYPNGSKGKEIVHESKFCSKCAEDFTKLTRANKVPTYHV